jgi:2-amino-4-hydroxy-6-hydroxymethyldihydropteridine diphosphokinase
MQAIALIGERIGTVEAQSSMYETRADGFESDNLFMNAVITVRSALEPHEVLSRTHQIELDLGCSTHRNADGSYCDRSLDIDLIACDDMVCHDDTLTLPHPRMHLRRFVLDPLCEIAPRWMHPILHRTATQLRDNIEK